MRLVRAERWYFFSNSGLQNQDVLYTCATVDGFKDAQTFLDPNKLSDDGTVALSALAFSHDGARSPPAGQPPALPRVLGAESAYGRPGLANAR